MTALYYYASLLLFLCSALYWKIVFRIVLPPFVCTLCPSVRLYPCFDLQNGTSQKRKFFYNRYSPCRQPTDREFSPKIPRIRCKLYCSLSALTLLVGWQEGHPACKKLEWLGAGVVVCLDRGADLHMAQLMPLPLTVSCFSKIQTGFFFLSGTGSPVLGSTGQRAVKRVCVFKLRDKRSRTRG